jgi:hypothetical protein
MDFQGWTFPTPDSMYAQSNNSSPFASNVSSYFHRPTKIVKPNSRNVSPRHSARRGTTSSVPSRTRSLLDRQRASLQRQFAAQQASRPLSWHPNTYPDPSYGNQFTVPDNSAVFYPHLMASTTAVNGLVTPMTYPMADEPQIQELITPLEELSAGTQYDTGNQLYPYQFWTGPDFSKQQLYGMDNMFPQQQMIPPAWMANPQFNAEVPTAPASPLFLPIQGGVETSPLNLDTQYIPAQREEGEELVGMGLYDSPADVQSSLLFGGGLSGNDRKRSLKLEESFEPAPETSDAEEGSDSEESEQDEEEEEDAEPTQTLPQEPTTQPTNSMAGQSFFFDQEAETNAPQYAPNYTVMPQTGYQMPMPGYGWV